MPNNTNHPTKDRTNHRKALSQLVQSGVLPTQNIEQALRISNITPTNHAWKNFLSNLLLWLGVVALSSSVMFFIAYNWNDLGRFAKFGLVEVLIAIAVLVYWKTNKNDSSTSSSKFKSTNLISQAALLVASLLLGVLLAFYGQTYQTGADTWELFLTWCILIIPWTIIARFPALWLVWLSLLNLSIIFYLETFRGVFGFIFYSETNLLWTLAIVNSTALIVWELLENRFEWLSESWAIRIIAIAAGTPLTFLVIESTFNRYSSILLPTLIWVAGMIAVYIVYRKIKIDLFMLAMACLSGISVIISFAGKVLFDVLRGEIGAFLFLAILVISLGAASAIWLKKVHKEQLT